MKYFYLFRYAGYHHRHHYAPKCRTVYDTVLEHKCEMVNRHTIDRKIFIML